MSFHATPAKTLRADSKPVGDLVPFYVCAGARETEVGYTVFPDGGTIEEAENCPARDICAWFAAHDFGGSFELADQPEARLLPVAYKAGPFSCPDFQDYEKLLKLKRVSRKCRCGHHGHALVQRPHS